MPKSITDTTVLNNGVKMPWFGLGVFRVEEGEEINSSVLAALEAGYRSIDTAAFYENEEGVGQAVRQSGLAREDIFVTSKVWNTNQGYEQALAAFDESMDKLGFDYLDLYLVHWPVAGKYVETWKALEKIYKDGRVRAIGVSNFQIHHLEDLLSQTEIVPTVNQVEYHPLLAQEPLLKYCQEKQIQLEAWRPLMDGKLDHPILHELAVKHNKTAAQIALRWALQNQVVIIPKSVKKQRIIENADIFDFELSAEDMAQMKTMNKNQRLGADPDNFNF